MKTEALLLSILLFTGCGGVKKGAQCECKLKMPQIPTVITEPGARAEYIAAHFWDGFNFADTACVNNSVTEQGVADYINALFVAETTLAERSITEMMSAAAVDSVSYRRFMQLTQKYLDDPNSPMRNETLYIAVLRHIVAGGQLSPLEIMPYQRRLDISLRNRPGNKAANVVYTLAGGSQGDLYGIKADYTLLFLNNPDCHMCAQLREELTKSPMVQSLVQSRKLAILALYPDQDITAWKNYRHNMPPSWINGYDKEQQIKENDTYDLRAIPTLYLLDRDKTVLIKDFVTLQQLEEYMVTNGVVPQS